MSLSVAPFRYDDHHTYLDLLLMVLLPQAISFIVAWITTVVLESMRYYASIHTIECDLPCEYCLHLLARFKYIIPTKYNTELISKS